MNGTPPVTAAVTLVAALLASAPATASFDEALYGQLLDRYTRAVPDTAGTRVDYRALSSSPRWRQLISSLEASSPAALRRREERLAFWINAYNVLAIDLVLQNYPVVSIRDIGSLFSPVWKREAGRIGGRSYSLHEIEHESDYIFSELGALSWS